MRQVVYCDGVRSACLGAGQWVCIYSKSDSTKEKARSWLRYQSDGAELLVLDGSALIRSHSSVSKLLSASNYISFFLNIFSAFGLYFLLFWLGTASNHIAHKPTNTSFDYSIIYRVNGTGLFTRQFIEKMGQACLLDNLSSKRE